MNNKGVKIKKWKIPNLIFFIFFLIIILLYIQYCYLSLSDKVYGKDLEEFAANRNTVTETLKAKRGTIYDSEGNTLASNINTYKLIATLDSSKTKDENNPKHVVDKVNTAKKLSEILGGDYDYFYNRLNQDKSQVEFGNYGRNLTELQKLKIEEENLPGIGFEKTVTRYYPNGDFASYIIGYAKSDDLGYISGKFGIELQFDKILTGKDGYYSYQQDKFENKIPDTPETRVDAVDGSDIYLTIDSSIQRFVESAVNEINETYNPDWTMITVMNAKTGEILASGTDPSYNPNQIPSDMSYQNPVTSYSFEPGSTMKVYTYMCAIENGVYNGSDKFKSGEYKVDDNTTIHDWNNYGWGEITYDTGFKYSSNVGIINIINNGFKVDDLHECLQKYGFGKKTGITLPKEVDGNINYFYKVEQLAAGYGQGISTTALQHLQALSIIANDGKMVTPYIVKKIVNSDGTIEETEIKKSSQLVKKSTVTKIKNLMSSVVNDTDGTGHGYYLEGYDIIAKTGTAQISEKGKYLTGDGNYIVSVSLMYPKDAPEIIIYAAVKKPYTNSSKVLSGAIKELIQSISKYKNMTGEQIVEDTTPIIILDSYISKKTEEVKTKLTEEGLNPIILGNGEYIIKQYPNKKTEVVKGDKVILLTNDKNVSMPNITGWARNDVIALCNLLNIEYEINGTGYVKSQSIISGSAINNQKLVVTLEDKKIN